LAQLLSILGMAALLSAVAVAPAYAQAPTCPKSPSAAPVQDFRGKNLTFANFSHQDLTNTDFTGATLTGAVFIHANLKGANFSNATIADSKNTLLPTDFSFADLTGACFIGAKFKGPTYFTYATLTSADFSETDIGSNAIFGQSPLHFDPDQSPRPAFRHATMDCEFIDDWKDLDLDRADIRACATQLAGLDLSGSNMAFVDFSRLDLTGVHLHKADLSGATFTKATLKKADLSEALLYGATLSSANLEGATLRGSHLTNHPEDKIYTAANLAGAYLKDVNLSQALLSGADFSNASFYGSTPVGQGTCTINSDGFTNRCASAAGATLNNTQFAGAYLYGVDFTNTTIQGVQFANAVLIGSNFTGAALSPDPKVGTDAGFNAAFLQGAALESATLSKTSLDSAFVDFHAGGNDMYLHLDGTHTTFPGWKKPGEKVCVLAYYVSPTTVPTDNTTLTCPDGSAARINTPPGCGPTKRENGHWKSGVIPSDASPPASYVMDATYTKAAAAICKPLDPNW
jgi:uncharacterized protein YjbI with pentapeptide repeats